MVNNDDNKRHPFVGRSLCCNDHTPAFGHVALQRQPICGVIADHQCHLDTVFQLSFIALTTAARI